MSKIVVIDNFFDDPKEIRSYGLSLPFRRRDREHIFEGQRTENLDEINPKLHGEIVKKFVDSYYGYSVDAVVDARTYFHVNSEVDMIDPVYRDTAWRIHRDEETHVGIVYLTRYPRADSGIYLYNGDEPDYIKNKWNRFIMFPSGMIDHCAGKFFGNDLFDSRLTLICFFNSIDIKS